MRVSPEISQFLRKECTRMPRLSDRAESDGRSRWRLRPCGLPLAHRCRHSGLTAFAARYPAYARPYRFLVCLRTETSARLGADVVRYTFIVEDLHLLLLASLLANLGDMPLKAGDRLGAGVLIGPHHLPKVFWIKLTGQSCRIHQVAEHHCELAPFGIGPGRGDWGGLALRRRDVG